MVPKRQPFSGFKLFPASWTELELGLPACALEEVVVGVEVGVLTTRCEVKFESRQWKLRHGW